MTNDPIEVLSDALRYFAVENRTARLDDEVWGQSLAALEQVKALRDAALPVLEYVSRGRGYVDVTPYPDASARRALGALIDSGDRAKEGS